MSIIRKEQLSNPLSASYALTASYALNANTSTINTGSLLVTASVSSNIITFTKGNTDQFSITVDTGSGSTTNTSGLVTTSSFNTFTASINTFTSSYNTGSFSGSFTGSFNGTASWAESSSQAITASYYKETDPIFTAVSGTFVLTSSFNAFTASINTFTASYNTGSFSGSFSGSFYGTSSWAYSASQSLTASYYQETDPVFTAVSGTFVLTSSFNAFTSSINTFTASYNTGSFTGSFSGSFYGTASWATNAQTASYVLQAISASFASNGGVTQLLAGPNISLSPTNGLGQVTVSSTGGGGGGNTATGSYGSFYSTVTQTNVASTARSMSLNVTDISNGVSISGSTNPYNTYIKTENPGVYDIQFSAQVDKTDSGTDEIWIWLRKNGVNVTDSATSVQLVGNGAHYVAAWNFFVNAAANDYFQLMWYSPDPNVRLHAEPAFGVVPGIPSLIVTANRVDQFLSNTGSFTGSFTGAFTGSLFGTAATASYYQETDPIFVAKSASLATTGSNNFNGNQTITGSLSQGLAGNIATGEYSHAEGSVTKAIGDYSHAEGDFTQATGNYSHAEGQDTMTLASAQYSHAEGNNTIAAANHQHVQGQWNVTSSIPAAFIVGNGTDNSNRSNLIYAHDSIVEITGSLSTTEFFTTTINETSLENFSSTSNYAGTVINTRTIDGGVVLYDVVYLDTDGAWYQNNQATAASSLKLGIYLGNDLILTEGHIVIDDTGTLGPDVQGPQLSKPIFIRDGAGAYMSINPPSGGYVRILGHIYYQNQNTDPNLYIMRFNPSNDFYLLG